MSNLTIYFIGCIGVWVSADTARLYRFISLYIGGNNNKLG